MEYLINSTFSALLVTYILTAFSIWLLRKTGDNSARLFTAFGIAVVAMLVLFGLSNAFGGPFHPRKNLPFYGFGFMVWFVLEWLGMRRRATKTAI